jgi:hypothetical protein
VHNLKHFWYRNLGFGLVTNAKACEGASQE